jgi:hypothetical protein
MNGEQTTNLTLAFAPKPLIVSVSPASPAKASQMTISGRNFGTKQLGSRLLLNGIDSTTSVTSWMEDQVQFTFQQITPDGAPWQARAAVSIEIAVSNDFTSGSQNVTTA